MAIDFFESQEEARRQTGRLVLLFALAVLAMTATVYAIAVGLEGYQGTDPSTGSARFAFDWWNPLLLFWVALGVGAVIGGGSLFKIAQLKAGGHVVAEQLGGRRVSQETADRKERLLLNVVEEMSIASGIPVPPVYIMDDEPGINAFAAGFSPSDAVVGVTRGAVDQFSRDELQGVIAHEFGHILNGDMRLNIRLMGILHGILILGLLGYFLLRSSLISGGGRSNRNQLGMALLALGLGLIVVGFLGTFFGNWIKASVSRQREYLADASAVQFTRNPGGIASALKRIAGFGDGSRLVSPNAPEASHLFFGAAFRNAMFATHPPIADRIRRLDPSFDPGSAQKVAAQPVTETVLGAAGLANEAPPVDAASQVGRPTAEHIDYAAGLLRAVPGALLEAAHEGYGARALVYALLLGEAGSIREAQFAVLEQKADPGVLKLTQKFVPQVASLERAAALPLVDLLLPALGELSPAQYQVFISNVDQLIRIDDRIDLFEWTLQRVLRTHLRPHFEKVSPPRVRYSSLERVRGECAVVLSVLTRGGSGTERGFLEGAAVLGLADLALLAPEECRLDRMDEALFALSEVTPRLKKRILKAGQACIAHDARVTIEEAELLRATADALGCPMPPLLPGELAVASR